VDQETFWNFVWPAFDGWIGKGVLISLALMSVGSASITTGRLLSYKAARKDSWTFQRQTGTPLRIQRPDDLISIAQTNKSPRAIVIASGLAAFQEARLLRFDAYAAEAGKRAAALSAKAVHHRMRRGLNHLSAIVVTVLFVGVFGTCYCFLTAFKGCGCSLEDLRAALSYEYSRALVPTAWSFLVAIPTMWAHRYFESEIDSWDLETETARLELMNYLFSYLERERSS
jgi:biopolymer transport protein ExbB